jgi:hypothetical protein
MEGKNQYEYGMFRILHYTCLLLGVLLVNVFSANLASHTSVKSYSQSIQVTPPKLIQNPVD